MTHSPTSLWLFTREMQKPSSKSRSVLTAEQAREIFAMKYVKSASKRKSVCNFLALKYDVCSKTIRDVWKGRSWLSATFDMWNVVERPVRRSVGRPKGSTRMNRISINSIVPDADKLSLEVSHPEVRFSSPSPVNSTDSSSESSSTPSTPVHVRFSEAIDVLWNQSQAQPQTLELEVGTPERLPSFQDLVHSIFPLKQTGFESLCHTQGMKPAFAPFVAAVAI
mmetsp:Transcript_42666/g.114216  ORF Transcript_42666/g.114216 Transcript_42666/m.114216 type:complete len:223 (-) Transcript_42666:98-766(-)